MNKNYIVLKKQQAHNIVTLILTVLSAKSVVLTQMSLFKKLYRRCFVRRQLELLCSVFQTIFQTVFQKANSVELLGLFHLVMSN